MVAQLITQTLSRFPRFAKQPIEVRPLEKGGSDRKFYRISISAGQSLILAKYGNQREENRHYVAIAQFMSEIGVRVPEIYFHDETESLIWMEDLGECDLWSFRDEPWEVRRELYRSALDQLLILHTRAHTASPTQLPQLQAEFNAELYRWEQNYFLENCLSRHFGLDPTAVEGRCNRSRLNEIAQHLDAQPRVFVHRDFQSQNIVVKDAQACFIDFQGMRPGLAQYDLASLIYDPYVTLTALERAALLAHYSAGLRAFGTEPTLDFAELFDLCAMQRLMQALGAYGFLGHVKGRADFLVHIPAAVRSLREVVGRIEGCEALGELLGELQV